MKNYSVCAGQLRKWKPSMVRDIDSKIFLVISSYEKSGIEWVDILLEGKPVTITASTIRIDSEEIE